MEDIFERRAVKLSWNEVSSIISKEIEDILGLRVQCKINRVEDSFWSVAFVGYRLPLPKLCQLVQVTQPTPEDWEDAMPDDGGVDVNGIGMALCEKLVARHLKRIWEHSLITEDSLWSMSTARSGRRECGRRSAAPWIWALKSKPTSRLLDEPSPTGRHPGKGRVSDEY